MKHIRFAWLWVALLTTANVLHAQNCSTGNEELEQRIAEIIRVLSSDSLEGREAGSQGEKWALQLVQREFENIGLKPVDESGSFFQSFEYKELVNIGVGTKMSINGKAQNVRDDFYPMPFSIAKGKAKGKAVYVGYGIEAPELDYNNYAGKKKLKGAIFVISISSPDGNHPHSKYLAHNDLEKRVQLAKEKGASAVVFISTDNLARVPSSKFKSITGGSIPVVYSAVLTQEMLELSAISLEIVVDMSEQSGSGTNAIGFLNFGAATTIVIGAHIDHLGYGHEGSLHSGDPAIHNGADDNASGIAGMIELARILAQEQKWTNNNYLFIAFSAEEKGLLGSKYWVEHPTIGLDGINYMLNYDMIGSMREDKIIINGVGTSPKWNEVLTEELCPGIQFTTTESGIGPSDHSSFYLKDIPAIHFFTGATENYHKPSDDFETVNLQGVARVVAFTEALIGQLDGLDKLAFTPTKNEQEGGRRSYNVSLGIMPDYSFEGPGVKVDGVLEDRPAKKAGLQSGDILMKLGDVEIKDMYGYMDALGTFQRGQTITAIVKRGEDILDFTITF